MEIGEKSFLITDSDLEPINTKLDTVVSDTTTLKSTTSNIDNAVSEVQNNISEISGNINNLSTKTDIEGVNSNVSSGNSNLSSKVDNLTTIVNQLSGKIDELLSGGSGGISSCIRHIQRGTGNIGSTERIVDVSLRGFSDIDKMFAIVNSSSVDSTGEVMGVTVSSLTATKLSVAATTRPEDTVDFSYQVIEFY